MTLTGLNIGNFAPEWQQWISWDDKYRRVSLYFLRCPTEPSAGENPLWYKLRNTNSYFSSFFLELQKVQHSSFKFGEAVKTNVHAANYLVGTFILLIDFVFVLRLLVPKAFLEWIQWIHRHPLSLVPSVIISTLWLSREMFHKKKFKKCIFKIDRKRE